MRTLYSVAGLIVLLDQITKYFAISYLKPRLSVPVIPGIFHLSFVENSGIAFGLFQNRPEFWTTFITLSVLVLLIVSWFFKSQPLSSRISFAFILGGALGNCVDRIRFAGVIDFLDFRIWPVFNLADSFITIGVIVFIWFTLKTR